MALADIFLPGPTPRPAAFAPWQTNTPLQRPTLPTDPNPASRLTPGQRVGLQYSRDRYNDGTYQVDAPRTAINPGNSPAITSFYGATDNAPGGGIINYPTYWDGAVQSPAAALAKALAYENSTGQQFARYPTQNAADWGEMKAVHPVMDQDATRILQTPEAQARIRAMMPGGR